MTTYKYYDELLQGRCKESRKVGNHTYAMRRVDGIAIRFHRTDIVTYKGDGTIVLDTGGWFTVTTKDRIDSFSPVRIHSVSGTWYVTFEGETVGWTGGTLTLVRGVGMCGGTPEAEQREFDAEYRRARRRQNYANNKRRRAELKARRQYHTVLAVFRIPWYNQLHTAQIFTDVCRNMMAPAFGPTLAHHKQVRVREWLWRHEIVTGGAEYVWLYKGVRDVGGGELISDYQHGVHAIRWPIGEDVLIEDPAYDGGLDCCGGGLHMSPTEDDARRYVTGTMIRVKVKVDEITLIGRDSYHTHPDKCKVPRVYGVRLTKGIAA